MDTWTQAAVRQRLEAAIASPGRLDWLDELAPDDVELVMARAKRIRWKSICLKLGISRATAHRKWQRSIDILVARLNGSEPIAKREWQRRFV